MIRVLGIVSALFVLAAVAIGFQTLGAFGYGAKDLVILLAPPAIGVVLFVVIMFYFGGWTARMLAKTSEVSHEAERDEKEKRQSPED